VVGRFVHAAATQEAGILGDPQRGDTPGAQGFGWSSLMPWVDWFPIVFFPLKIIVLGVGMFFAIKWHYDQGKKKKRDETDKS